MNEKQFERRPSTIAHIGRDRLISRRSLLRTALAAGLALPAVSLLSACGDDDGNGDDAGVGADVDDTTTGDDDAEDIEDSDDSSDEPETSDRPRGGSVRVAMPGFPESLDPHISSWIESVYPAGMMYSGLVRMSPEMEPEAELATSWEANEDADEWTFEVRTGVLFHNGREMMMDDVVFSFERLLDPDLGSPFLTQIAMIESVEAVADDAVVFHLNTTYPDFPTVLGNTFARIVAEEATDNLDTDAVGTGPYKLEHYATAERIVVSRFDDFYDLDNFGFIDEMHFITMGEETSRMTALTGGEIDLVPDISPAVVSIAEQADNVVVGEVVTGTYSPVVMNVNEEPFTDQRVRTALKLCADRAQFVDATVQGYGEEAADQPIPSILPTYGNLPIPERDVDRARELLAEAGYPDGIDVVLHTSAGRIGMQETALTIQELAQPAGIRIDVQNHPIDVFWAEYWMLTPMFSSNWNLRPNADQILSLGFVSGANWNEADWSNEEFDELVNTARETIDEDERNDLYRRAQEILAEDGGVLITCFRTGLDARNRNLMGYESHPLRWAELHKCWLEEA